jgi:hypothetical protein
MFKVLLASVLLVAVALASPAGKKGDIISRTFYGFGFHTNACSEPTPDPNHIVAGFFNISILPLIELSVGSKHGGMDMAGHSGLVTEVEFNLITLTANVNLQLPSLDIALTLLHMFGSIDVTPFTCLPSGPFNSPGTEDGTAHVKDLQITASATVFVNLITGKVSLSRLTVSVFVFNEVCFNLGPSFTVAENPLDYDDLCANLKARFDVEWADSNKKNQLVENVRVAANLFLKEYSLQDFIDLITGPTNPPCTTPPALA